MTHNKLLTIHEFAQMCKTTPRTLRFYEKLGLLKPVKKDKWNKYRLYSPFQTRDFFRIKLLQNFHVPLKEITPTLERHEKEFLSDRILNVRDELESKKKELSFLTKIKSFLFQEVNLHSALKRDSFGSYILFSTQVPEGRYDLINKEIITLHKAAKSINIPLTGREMVFYLEQETYKPRNTRLEIGLITKFKKIPEHIKVLPSFYFKYYPKTEAYVYTYQGPYEFITLIYERLHQLNILKELSVRFAPFDIHIYGPWNKTSSYDHVTKICFPRKQVYG